MAQLQKVALITGAGTGIGKAVALALMKEGYAAVLAGRRKEKLEETANEGRSARSLPCRLTMGTWRTGCSGRWAGTCGPPGSR